MPDSTLENAARKAKLILEMLAHKSAPLGSSMGVVAFPNHGPAAVELLRVADAALYRAKQGGGGRIVVA
jgi:GGDEF domain-containing protein